jgi:hypothetical protein
MTTGRRDVDGAFADAFDAAMADPSIGAIVIDVDSPGGSVDGTPELAKRIFDARGTGQADHRRRQHADGERGVLDLLRVRPDRRAPSAMKASARSASSWCTWTESGYDEQVGLKYTLISARQVQDGGQPVRAALRRGARRAQGAVDEYYDVRRRGGETSRREGEGRPERLRRRPLRYGEAGARAGLIDRIARSLSTKERDREARRISRSHKTVPRPEALPFALATSVTPRAESRAHGVCTTCGAALVPSDDDPPQMVCPQGCTPARADDSDDDSETTDNHEATSTGGRGRRDVRIHSPISRTTHRPHKARRSPWRIPRRPPGGRHGSGLAFSPSVKRVSTIARSAHPPEDDARSRR